MGAGSRDALTTPSQRKYSLGELDEMREALMMRHWSGGQLGIGSAYEWAERELRTHMLNGSEPAEVIENAKSRARR